GGALVPPPAPPRPGGGGAPAAPAGGVDGDVVEALVGLGWPEKGAVSAVEAVRAEDDAAPEAADLLRRALRRLGGSR
ncbi:MAG: Holliday junction branch migration protein RuvA, partial [Brachybacterium sp.]|nr:Holliday junction branch migration protein RuvA [Brachybacterium sp.]